MALHLVSREFKADFRIWGILIILLASHSLALAEEAHEWVTDPSEVIALRAVRSRLIDPMNSLISWNKGDPCRSKWKGVSCFDNVLNTSKDGYLHIQELLLLNMNLSGSLAPEIGQLSHLEILDFMWNNIQGSIPKEIGSIKSLKLLLLNGNQLSGSLPDGLGYLSKLNRLQIDENNISGPIPKSFVNLIEMRHLHMNNNSISGQIPPELAQLPKILHFLLDNNNLSGHLPPNFSESQSLLIFQLDNNNFSGSSIPVSYGKFTKLVKLSLRNCSLQGTIPDLSEIPELTYLDLSWNQLEGSIPSKKLSANITTIELSNNKLNGSIPTNFSGLPNLQKLSLKNNMLTGSFPSVWENMTFRENASLILDFQNNSLSNVSSSITPPLNVTILLQGNQVCSNANQLNVIKFCNSTITKTSPGNSSSTASGCLQQSCPKDDFFEYNPASPLPCYCAAPIRVGYRLKSPGFSDFFPYMDSFEAYLDLDVSLTRYQLYIDSFVWEEGPRLRMYLKIFPNLSPVFNESEVRRIRNMFAGWKIHNRDIFGPYELLNFTLLGPYSNMILDSRSGWNRGALLGIIIGTVAGAIVLSTIVSLIIMKRHMKYQHLTSKRSSLSNSGIKVDGVKDFSFEEIAQATSNFCNSAQIGQGGYGTVYKGILTDGTIVAIKRAQEGSLQGSKEFCNEIEFLSRLHHRNLVSLVGYCDEESEQMLIYEFMPNGTLRDHLSIKSKKSLGFPLRLRIALGSAKGILYLHTEADPPVFHRDIKATNILLDSKFTAKVADFGLSILAPVPDDDGMVHGHVSTVVRGTPGYLDPEYFLTHKLTDKSDVYSLGVVFLELLTGMHPISHGKNIVREARNAYQHGRISSIIDKRMDSYPQECVEKFMSLALKCCDEITSARPSMAEVVRELEVIWRMTPDIDVTVSMETDSSPVESQSSISGDLYKSLNHSCSDTQKSGITMVYPR